MNLIDELLQRSFYVWPIDIEGFTTNRSFKSLLRNPYRNYYIPHQLPPALRRLCEKLFMKIYRKIPLKKRRRRRQHHHFLTEDYWSLRIGRDNCPLKKWHPDGGSIRVIVPLHGRTTEFKTLNGRQFSVPIGNAIAYVGNKWCEHRRDLLMDNGKFPRPLIHRSPCVSAPRALFVVTIY